MDGHDGLAHTEPCRHTGFPATLDVHAMPRCPVSQHSAHTRDWPHHRWPQSGLRALPSCLVPLCPCLGATTLEDTRQDTLFHKRGAHMLRGWPLGTQLPVCVASSRHECRQPPRKSRRPAPEDAVLTLVTGLGVSGWESGWTMTQSSLCVNLWLIKPQLTKVQFLPRPSSPRQCLPLPPVADLSA